MSNNSTVFATDPDSIDAIIDSVAADPRQAARAKSLLRDKAIERKTVLAFPSAIDANDDEDMWDNMPV